MIDNSHKIDSKCDFCGEPIKKGDMTLHESGRYLCVSCQIDLNRKTEYKDILRKRRKELLVQLSEINKELGIDYCIMYV